MKKTIKDYDLAGKKVLIRVDFNVPIQNGYITDDYRIQMSLKTIQYAIQNQAKVILLSHLGRIQTEEDFKKYNLEPVACRLRELLGQEVIFIDETRGSLLEDEIKSLENGQVLLVQNTRYEDLVGKKESSNDPELGQYWASLGDIFINDAFGTCHREHASNVGIASYLPSGIGFLIEKELQAYESVLQNPKHPFTIILGGAKVSDKIDLIENLIKKVDFILTGGGIAYTFLKASGLSVGKSLVDLDHLDFCKRMLEEYPGKIILPIDSVNTLEVKENVSYQERFISDFKENEIGLDIGYNTIKLYRSYLEESEIILWNGTLGMTEICPFYKGTEAICNILKKNHGVKIVGGGDTSGAVIQLGYEEGMTHVSTGGGASLALLEGKKLPGIEIIEDQ